MLLPLVTEEEGENPYLVVLPNYVVESLRHNSTITLIAPACDNMTTDELNSVISCYSHLSPSSISMSGATMPKWPFKIWRERVSP